MTSRVFEIYRRAALGGYINSNVIPTVDDITARDAGNGVIIVTATIRNTGTESGECVITCEGTYTEQGSTNIYNMYFAQSSQSVQLVPEETTTVTFESNAISSYPHTGNSVLRVRTFVTVMVDQDATVCSWTRNLYTGNLDLAMSIGGGLMPSSLHGVLYSLSGSVTSQQDAAWYGSTNYGPHEYRFDLRFLTGHWVLHVDLELETGGDYEGVYRGGYFHNYSDVPWSGGWTDDSGSGQERVVISIPS